MRKSASYGLSAVLADEDLDVVHAARTARIMRSSSGGIVLPTCLRRRPTIFSNIHLYLRRACARAARETAVHIVRSPVA